jgi:undecaprenyl-diphosphatase
VLGWDRHLESWIADHRVSALDPVFRGLTYIGTWGAVWLVIAAVAAARSRRLAVLVWVAVADLVAQLTTALIKAVTHRDRPHVHALVGVPHTHSFPSGHAASSLACAVVLAAYLPRLQWPLYVLAALIAYSRLYVGVHFPLDVLAGALLGFLLGKATLALARATERRRSSSGSHGTP